MCLKCFVIIVISSSPKKLGTASIVTLGFNYMPFNPLVVSLWHSKWQ